MVEFSDVTNPSFDLKEFTVLLQENFFCIFFMSCILASSTLVLLVQSFNIPTIQVREGFSPVYPTC